MMVDQGIRRSFALLAVVAGGAFALMLGAAVIWIAISQPHVAGLVRGDPAILAFSDGTRTVRVDPDDRVDEPDVLATYDRAAASLARQDAIWRMMRDGGDLSVHLSRNGKVEVAAITVAARRPIGSLPPDFWVQLLVGFGSFAIGLWTWRLRPAERETQMFALTGLALLVASYASAIYTTRQFGLAEPLFRATTAANHGGAQLFGAALVVLGWRFPRPVMPAGWMAWPFVVQLAWWALDVMRVLPGPELGAGFALMLCLVVGVIGGLVQYRAARGDPQARTILRWFGTAILVGSGIPVALIVVPPLFGQPMLLPQGYAFGFFLLIYAGAAVGVARFRLFDLDNWAFAILFYAGVLLAMLAVDVVLVGVVAMAPTSALGIAFMTMAFVYLPLRAMLLRKLWRRTARIDTASLERVFALALSEGGEQAEAWRAVLARTFSPASMVVDEVVGPADSLLLDEGAGLRIPSVGPIPALRLEQAARGMRLFSAADVRLADELVLALRHAFENRDNFERGVLTERQRIAADVHDNLGIQLMSALHSPRPEHKDEYLRDAIRDLRDIVNDRRASSKSLELQLAELRAELADLLDLAGVSLDWQVGAVPTGPFSARLFDAVRAVLREAATNTVKHAGASRFTVRISMKPANGSGPSLVVTVDDDGRGFGPDGDATRGSGLRNLAARLAAVGGQLDVSGDGGGMRLVANWPMERA